MEMQKQYNHEENEDKIYELWEKSGYFNPDNAIKDGVIDPDAPTFSMVLPPPNVTGTLHMGHAAMLAIEDAIVRFWRQKGSRVLWVPGTDHAAIATQSKVEKELYDNEKITRHDLGRKEFVKKVEDFASESHDTIVNQIRKMGASVDWSREAYTLDAKREKAVRKAFKEMYDKGLIYKGEKIVNWDPKMKTTISDDEIEWVEETTPFYYLKLGSFIIGTARPETKFADKYIVVHPDDERYKKYQDGQKIKAEWINGEIEATIIKDKAINMEFGTGAMTITPWHDALDFEISERRNLEKIKVIDEDGKLLPITGQFAGLTIKKARPLIVEKMRQKGLIEKVDEKYTHRIAKNSRGGGVIEPQIKKQWWVNVNKPFKIQTSKNEEIESEPETTLKDLMRKAIDSGQITITPKRFEKIYLRWIDNLRDWNISRQLWYGHRIPVWYKGDQIYCATEPPKKEGWKQDPDTLDTWFSSGTWTFSALGWPEQSLDLKNYHPTSILETGYDILFFWVARMILMSGCLLGEVPFTTVLLHGMVRDEKGRKMSKSLGNIVDPLDLIKKYGADATRLSLISGLGLGNDISISEDKTLGHKKYANKLWNIARFILSQTEKSDFEEISEKDINDKDKKILAEIDELAKSVEKKFIEYRIHLAAEEIYQYVWHTFADSVLEESKEALKDEARKESRKRVLAEALKRLLILQHPFLPFITETIWQKLPRNEKSMLMTAQYPKNNSSKSTV